MKKFLKISVVLAVVCIAGLIGANRYKRHEELKRIGEYRYASTTYDAAYTYSYDIYKKTGSLPDKVTMDDLLAAYLIIDEKMPRIDGEAEVYLDKTKDPDKESYITVKAGKTVYPTENDEIIVFPGKYKVIHKK